MRKITTIIILAFGIFAIYQFWNSWNFISTSKDTFGIKIETEEKLLDYSSTKDLFGDGFSIEVIKLNIKSKDYFINPPQEFFESYPLNEIAKEDYRIQKWQKTPQKTEDKLKNHVATLPLENNRREGLTDIEMENIEKYLSYTKTSLNQEGCYYAMNFSATMNENNQVEGVKGIDLYVVNPTDGIVIKINRQ